MKKSLARRIFRTIFAIGVVNVLATLVAVEYIYEDVEETILSRELAQERAFLEERIDGKTVHSWNSALLTATYVPDGHSLEELPDIFAGVVAPFSAEVGIGERSYLISVERTAHRPGVLYIAQDITLLEDREDFMQWAIAALCAAMLLLGLLLARHGTQRVVRPLQDLTREIGLIEPGTPINRIGAAYAEHELAEIATTLNDLLGALDAYVQREKSLVSLASHELRTPLAVIGGALDVIDQRGTLGEADRRTLARIRRAADEMRSDVDALLKLARRADTMDERTAVDLPACVDHVIVEIQSWAPDTEHRIRRKTTAPNKLIHADPALVRMLLRNLIQNAVRHTQHSVEVCIGESRMTISDEGPGLPDHVQSRITDDRKTLQVPEDGLGLFIVRLICERLGWSVATLQTGPQGTVIEIAFAAPAVTGTPRSL